ncbi:MAG: hypothetical protein RMI50_01830, partial [Aquificaceae bacterium]|nr:hypothetical protein [Aquificaceae bacterium]
MSYWEGKRTFDRRELIKYVFIPLLIGGCGGSASSDNTLASQPPTYPPKLSIKFGLGDDPEKLINGYDLDGLSVLNTLMPDIVCFWLNGASDNAGRVYGESMNYIREWASKGRFSQWSNAGYELMLITWENYDGQNPSLGQPTYGNYHISEQFLIDLNEILDIIKAQFKNKLYIALATEQSTYTACRFSQSCLHAIPYTDSINQHTIWYFSRLRENLLKAVDIIKAKGLNVEFGPCFGGWLVEFSEGINFIRFFDEVIARSNAVFFQSMFDKKPSENNGYGNPQRIMKNCEFFSSYRKPIHLAHYMPASQRSDVVFEDMSIMSNQSYLRRLYSLGLRSFSFMYYGLVKDNQNRSLEALQNFRNMIK